MEKRFAPERDQPKLNGQASVSGGEGTKSTLNGQSSVAAATVGKHESDYYGNNHGTMNGHSSDETVLYVDVAEERPFLEVSEYETFDLDFEYETSEDAVAIPEKQGEEVEQETPEEEEEAEEIDYELDELPFPDESDDEQNEDQ